MQSSSWEGNSKKEVIVWSEGDLRTWFQSLKCDVTLQSGAF